MTQDTFNNPILDVSLFSLPLSTQEIFGNSKSTSLEIGFGEGEFLVEVAADNPERNYLGIEIKYFRYKKALKLSREKNLQNIKLLHFDAALAVEQVFLPESFDMVYINFPDPWPKDRHKKHRIVNNRFLDNLHKVMKQESILEFTSDHFEYVTHTIVHFEEHGKFINKYCPRGFSKSVKNRPITKFEKEFRKEGREIYYLAFKK